jgi:hypothetical protein
MALCRLGVNAAAAWQHAQIHRLSSDMAAAAAAGGKVGVLMASRPQTLDAICSAHPGGMEKVRHP